MMDAIISAYLAGLFDGEGSVRLRLRVRDRLQRYKDKVYPHHQRFYELGIDIANRNRDVLELCKQEFGGRIYKAPLNSCLHWCLEGKKAMRFLETIRLYVIIKKPHIETILNNLENKEYASRVLTILNKRGTIETKGNIPLM